MGSAILYIGPLARKDNSASTISGLMAKLSPEAPAGPSPMDELIAEIRNNFLIFFFICCL